MLTNIFAADFGFGSGFASHDFCHYFYCFDVLTGRAGQRTGRGRDSGRRGRASQRIKNLSRLTAGIEMGFVTVSVAWHVVWVPACPKK